MPIQFQRLRQRKHRGLNLDFASTVNVVAQLVQLRSEPTRGPSCRARPSLCSGENPWPGQQAPRRPLAQSECHRDPQASQSTMGPAAGGR